MQKEKLSFHRQANYWLGVMIIGLVVGLGVQFAQAWVNPPQSPPNGNVAGPVTTGAGAQYKSGTLGVNINQAPSQAFEVGGNALVNGALISQSFYDSNDNNYLVDPNGYSRLNYGVYNNLFAHGWLQSSIFYDANNNGYYVDPDNGSRLNYGLFNNIGIYGKGWSASTTDADWGQTLVTKDYVDSKIHKPTVSVSSAAIVAWRFPMATAQCPEGTVVTGGGGFCWTNAFMTGSVPSGNGWMVGCGGLSDGWVYAQAYATCQ